MSAVHAEIAKVPASADDAATLELAAQLEPFDSFWEGPEHDVDGGYGKFYQFYKANYLQHLPAERDARVLVISCGPGYFVETLKRHGYRHVIGIDSFEDKVAHGQRRGLDCREARALPFLAAHKGGLDVIICEQELNHLTKAEMRIFLSLVRDSLTPGGTLLVHALNGANPITGAEASPRTSTTSTPLPTIPCARSSASPASRTSTCSRSISTCSTRTRSTTSPGGGGAAQRDLPRLLRPVRQVEQDLH